MLREAGTIASYALLRERYLDLRKQHADTIALVTATQRHFIHDQTAGGSWRALTGARALICVGALRFSNAAFDRLNRDSVIGPGWRLFRPDTEVSEEPSRTLVDIVLDEARLLIEEQSEQRESRYVRGTQLIAVMVELQPMRRAEQMIVVTVRELRDLPRPPRDLALHARVAEKQREIAADELALGVAHDLGNLVGALRARLQVLAATAAEQSRHHLQAAGTIVDAQAALVARLRTRAPSSISVPRALGLLAQVIGPALEIVEAQLVHRESACRIVVRIDPALAALPAVMGVRDDLVNVIVNLVVNASAAMPRGGTIALSGEARQGSVALWVDDGGEGIPVENLGRIFQPHFTTKGDNGSGLGLAMARDVLTHAGGGITASNRTEGGARFELTFALGADQKAGDKEGSR